MRPSSNLFTATATKPRTRARGLSWQLNERVVLLVLAESHADVVSAMRGWHRPVLGMLVDKASNFLVGDVHGT